MVPLKLPESLKYWTYLKAKDTIPIALGSASQKSKTKYLEK